MIRSFVLAFLSILLILPAQAASPLDALDAERKNLKTLSFDALIETPKAEGRWSRIEMTFAYAAPNFYRSRLKMGIEGDLLTVSDGTTLYSYSTRTRQVYRQSYKVARKQLLRRGPIDPVTALATTDVPLSMLYDVVDQQDGAAGVTLSLVPKRAVPNYDRLELTLSPDLKSPLRAVSYKHDRIVAKITFRNVRKNAKAAPETFIFTIPEGVEIIDL